MAGTPGAGQAGAGGRNEGGLSGSGAADQVAPNNREIEGTADGGQSSNASDMVFHCARIASYAPDLMTLERPSVTITLPGVFPVICRHSYPALAALAVAAPEPAAAKLN